MSDLMGKTALEEKWKKEEEAKAPLEKAYEGGKNCLLYTSDAADE